MEYGLIGSGPPFVIANLWRGPDRQSYLLPGPGRNLFTGGAVRRTKLAMVGAATALAMVVPQPADAATTGDTTVTFTVTAGALNITVPASVNLGSGAAATSLTGQMGPVTVDDLRGALTATWTTTVSSTDFATGGGTPAETIPKAAVSYWSDPATATSGIGVFTPGQLTALLAQSLSVPRTAFTLTLGVGNNSCTWNPSLIVAIPAATVAGLYTGTVTHSVAP